MSFNCDFLVDKKSTMTVDTLKAYALALKWWLITFVLLARFSYPGLGCIHAFPRSASLGPKTLTFIRNLHLASVLKLSKFCVIFVLKGIEQHTKRKHGLIFENKHNLKIWF